MISSRLKYFALAKPLGIISIVLLSVLIGCQPKSNGTISPGTLQAIDPIYLQNELHMLIDESMAIMSGTVTEIAAGTQDRSIRENSLRLKIRAFDVYLKILAEEDPRLAFVYNWTAAVQLRQYLTEGVGKDIFGLDQPKAVAMAKMIEANIVRLGEKHFSQTAMQGAAPEIEEAARHFLRGASFVSQPTTTVIVGNKMMALAKLPLLPVTSLRRVSETPDAINRFTDTAEKFAQVVQHLPERLRWQMELLMMEMESSGPMMSLNREMIRLETIMRETTAELMTVPEKIGIQIQASLNAVEQMQPELRQTLVEAQAVAQQAQAVTLQAQASLETVQAVTRQAGDLAQNFTQTAQAFETAVKESRALVADFDQFRQPAPGSDSEASDKKGATVADYQAAAESFTAAAREIRAALADLQRPWPEQTGLKQTATEFQKLIDVAFWRAVLLLAIAFLLALLYRIAARRFSPIKK